MNLTVSQEQSIIFSHDGHWLHPLFALEDFLKNSDVPPEELKLQDKLIGRAAAILISRMGILHCHGNIVSERALSYFAGTNVSCSYNKLIERLDCQTELILTDEMSDDEAYRELSRRAGRV